MINLETQVSYFERMGDVVPTENISLGELFSMIANPESPYIKPRNFRKTINDCRDQEQTKAFRQNAKQKLPAVTLSAVLKTRSANLSIPEKIGSYTGLIQIDFDNVEDVSGLKQKLIRDPFTVFVCISPSGTGIKTAIISPSIEQHERVFLDAERYFLEKYGTKIDPSVKDIGRYMFLTIDPEIYVKSDLIYFEYPEIADYPIAVEIRKPGKKEIKKEYQSSNEIESLIQTIEQNQIDITSNRGEWLKIAFAIINEYGEDGREFFHRISIFYPKYSRKETDNFYSSLMKSNRGKVGINTLFWIAQKHGLRFEKDVKPDNDFFVFWDFVKGKKPTDPPSTLKFSQTKVMKFLEFEGFGLWKHPDQERDPGFLCRVQNCIIEKSTVDLLRRHLLDYVNSLPDLVFDGIPDGRDRVLDMIIQDNTLSPAKICALPFFTEKEHTNTISDGFYYFKNGFVKVNKEGAKLFPYNTIPAGFVVWKSSIINHDLDLLSGETTDFEQLNFVKFLMNLCTNRESKKFHPDRFEHLRYCLGFVLFRPDSEIDLKALIISEFNLDPRKYQGRTGKTLLIRAIMKMLYPAIIQSGKGWNSKDKFRYQNVEPDCKVFAINDCEANLNFESFFTDIVDGMQVEKKFEKGIYIFEPKRTPQMIFSCNYGIKGSGDSFSARRLDLELLPYYNKDFTPDKELGNMIGDQWNKDQWDMFYSFMMDCVHERICAKKPPVMDMGTINFRQFQMDTHTDFPDFAKENIQPGIYLDLVSICSTWCEFSGTNEKTFDKSKMGRWINRYADYLSLSGSGKYEYKKIRIRKDGNLIYQHIVDLFPHA